MLTKILQIDQKLTFNVFHILNQYRISKIEKIFDGTDPRQKKVVIFFVGGGVWSLKVQGFGVCLGPQKYRKFISIVKFLQEEV